MRQASLLTFKELGRVWSKTTAVLPFGSFEAHGPHLPVDTDGVILEGILSRLELDRCLLLPLINYTPINQIRAVTGEAPGMLSVSGRVFEDFVNQVVDAVVAQGVRRS